MPRGARIDFSESDVVTVMRALYDSERGEAAELHDRLAVIYGDRLAPDFRWTVTVFRTDGEDIDE